ncbi:prepilin-type N-terminal cleavage/methylation domain-containing protein [Methylobacterium sp. JK268]
MGRVPSGGRADGFSLVEMLVVLAILSLAALAGGVVLNGLLPGRRLDAAAASLARELAATRGHARLSGALAVLRLDPDRHLVLSTRPGAPALALAGFAVAVEAGPGSRAAPGEIRFAPDGSSSGGAVLLAGPGGRRRLVVSRLTGRVAEESGPP